MTKNFMQLFTSTQKLHTKGETTRGVEASKRLATTFLLALSMLTLVSCGGGSSSGTTTPPVTTPISSDFGGKIIGKIARNGVAGTWGYTAADGHNYAIMGTAKGVLVLDLIDPTNPRVVDEVDGPTDTSLPGIYWREMRVYGTHAYIVSEHTNVRGGIMILDLSALPKSVRYVTSVVPRDGQLAAHSVDIDTARGLLYLQRESNAPGSLGFVAPSALQNSEGRQLGGGAQKSIEPVGGANRGSIEIWDIKTDPEHPTYVSTFNGGKSIHDMTAVGKYCYVAEGNAHSYSIWNVEDPKQPVLQVRWEVEAGHFSHNIWPSADGSFVVTTEELPFGLPAKVWKLNGASAPTLLSSFKSGTGTPHNVIMEGNLAYLSHYSEGAMVVDLANPAAPRTIAHVDTNSDEGPALGGCWGVYKFPGQNLMICSDIGTGFNLIRITGS